MSVIEYKHPEDELEKTGIWSWKECAMISALLGGFTVVLSALLWYFAPELRINSSMPIFGELPFTLTLKQLFGILPFYAVGLVLFYGRMEDKEAFGGWVWMGFVIGAACGIDGFGLFGVFLAPTGAMMFSLYGAMLHDAVVNGVRRGLDLEDEDTVAPVIFAGLISGFSALVAVGLGSFLIGLSL